MGVVIVPCWRRPEFLYATLNCLCEAVRAQCYEYLISIDRGYDPCVYDVIAAIAEEHSWFRERLTITAREHDYKGPAYNILSAWHEARTMAQDASWIALVEEDVLVGRSFFEFLDAALAFDLDPTAFGVSACANQNRAQSSGRGEYLAILGEDAVYGHVSYQSLAVALRPNSIDRIFEYLEPRYFDNPIAFCREKFGDSGLPDANASQDGFIHRVMRHETAHLLYPCVPRAFHAGWYGVNRDGRSLIEDDPGFRHAINWREAAIMIRHRMTSEQMNALGDPRFQDIARCDLNRGHVPLKLV